MKKTLLTAALVTLAFAGCRPEEFTLERLDPGADCANGGVRLTVPGKAPQVVCDGKSGTNGTNGTNGADGTTGTNGTNGAVSLTTQTPIDTGDVRCPAGGVLVSSGLDSGGDGGTPNDGTLQAGEVQSSTVVCNGGTGAVLTDLTPPGGAAGTHTLKVNSGTGTANGNTSNAGIISIGHQTPSRGGAVLAWKTGQADTSFTAPDLGAVDPGAKPLNITTNTTLPFFANGLVVDAGVVFASNDGIYEAQSDGGFPVRFTSLNVAAGATLTLPPVGYTFERGCRVAGTLVGTRDNTFSNYLSLYCADIQLASTSNVHGDFDGFSFQASSRIGDLVAAGTIDVSATAAQGGGVTLSGAQALYATGTIKSNGGVSNLATAGGTINLTGYKAVKVKGTIEANGSDTAFDGESAASGGPGGALYINQTYLGTFERNGPVVLGATITLKGGKITNTTGCTPGDCIGGNGGRVQVATTSSVTLSGTWNLRGGDAPLGWGGTGGEAAARIIGSYGPTARGDLLVSADIDATGGDGDNGGQGGNLAFNTLDAPQAGTAIVLLGYASFEAKGGFGGHGGAGGRVNFFELNNSWDNATPSGAIINQVDVTATGGESMSSMGAFGGSISIAMELDTNVLYATWETTSNSGHLDVSGGRGVVGGTGGAVTLRGAKGLTQTGAIDSKGGPGTTQGGGGGGNVGLISGFGTIINSAQINTSGGIAGGGPVLFPGHGGSVVLIGQHSQNAGALLAKGGVADLMTGTGGNGGFVAITSEEGTSTITVPAPAGIDVSGGTAATPGLGGMVNIDGKPATSDWTH